MLQNRIDNFVWGERMQPDRRAENPGIREKKDELRLEF